MLNVSAAVLRETADLDGRRVLRLSVTISAAFLQRVRTSNASFSRSCNKAMLRTCFAFAAEKFKPFFFVTSSANFTLTIGSFFFTLKRKGRKKKLRECCQQLSDYKQAHTYLYSSILINI